MRLLLALLSLFWVFLLFMTGGRFLLLLFDANKSNEVVDWILRHSDYWVKPFFNLFDLSNKTVEETGGVLEPASLIAFIVYFVVGSLILNVVRSSFWGGWGGWGRRRGWRWGF